MLCAACHASQRTLTDLVVVKKSPTEQQELLAAAGLSDSATAKVKEVLGLDGEATVNELAERATDKPKETVKRTSVKSQPVVMRETLLPPPDGKFSSCLTKS